MKKWWVKLLLVLTLILLAAAILFLNSGDDSKKRVEAYRNHLRAAGEKLNVDDFLPPHVDPDKNGAALFQQAARFMAPRGATAVSTNPPAPMTIVAPGKAWVAWQQSEIVSLMRRHELVTNTWTEIGDDLTNESYALETLQQAAQHPQFDFGLDYHQIPLSMLHLPQLREATTLLSAQVICDLRRGDTAAAATNLGTLLTIANAGENERTIGSQIYRVIMIQRALATQWEWLLSTNIDEAQLTNLQARWTNMNLLEPMEKAMEMTRATASATRELMRTGTGPFTPSRSGSTYGGNPIQAFFQTTRFSAGNALWRDSWSYDDELNMMEGWQVMIETARQIRTDGYFKDALAERERKIAALGFNRTNINWLRARLGTSYPEFGALEMRGMATQLDRILATEAARQCAIAAIGLKRYQLRHGTMPKDLSALSPEILPALPLDPGDGKPLRYRLNADGTFVLYSIGLDGVDDGGDATPVPAGMLYQWQPARDWVWPQPATPAEVQNYYDHPPK